MQKELIEKANTILQLIAENESAVRILSKLLKREDKETTLYTKQEFRDGIDYFPEPIKFDRQEIRRIIRQKKRKIVALKEELERL